MLPYDVAQEYLEDNEEGMDLLKHVGVAVPITDPDIKGDIISSFGVIIHLLRKNIDNQVGNFNLKVDIIVGLVDHLQMMESEPMTKVREVLHSWAAYVFIRGPLGALMPLVELIKVASKVDT